MILGKMDKRVVFQADVKTPDGSGGSTMVWTDFYECWARVRPMKASRKLADNQTVLVQVTEVTIRYNDQRPITKDLRMTYGGGVYTIHSIVDIEERHEELQIIVERKP